MHDFVSVQMKQQYSYENVFVLWSAEAQELIAEYIAKDFSTLPVEIINNLDTCSYTIDRIFHLLRMLQGNLYTHILKEE